MTDRRRGVIGKDERFGPYDYPPPHLEGSTFKERHLKQTGHSTPIQGSELSVGGQRPFGAAAIPRLVFSARDNSFLDGASSTVNQLITNFAVQKDS